MTSDAVPTSGPDPRAGTFDNHDTTVTPPPIAPPTTGGHTPTRRKRALKTRTGYTWTALVTAAVLGILLLVFILQNLEQVHVDLLFWSFSIPLGVMILLAVIVGTLVMALVGGGRIVQLRRANRRL